MGETTTQVVLIVPVLIMILLIAVQAAVYFHTSNVAGAAASHGAAAAAVNGSSSAMIELRARTAVLDIMSEAGADIQGAPVITVSGESVTIAVEALVPRLVPYFPRTVRRVATEPRERFLTESMR